MSNRKQLLAKLRETELKGLGGTTVSDIKEAVYNHEKALVLLQVVGLSVFIRYEVLVPHLVSNAQLTLVVCGHALTREKGRTRQSNSKV